MAETSPAPKQMSLRDLLTGLLSSGVVFALIAWQLAQARNPALPPEIGYADAALAANNDKQARREFERLIAQAPDAPVVYSLVVGECAARRRPDLSLTYAYRALDACKYAPNPGRAELYELLSSLYLEEAQGAGRSLAQDYARRALELDPDSVSAQNGYGYALLESARSMGEVNVALGYIQKALQTLRAQSSASPGLLAAAEDSYGWGLYRRGAYNAADYPLAVNALQQALDDLPADVAASEKKIFYYHLGAACRAARRPDDARHALQVALFYDPKYRDAQRELELLSPAPDAPASNLAPAASGAPSAVPSGVSAVSPAAPASASVPASSAAAPPLVPPPADANSKPAFKPLDVPKTSP